MIEVLLQGMKADVNLIDFDNLDVTYPSIAHDLPAGGKRVVQKSKVISKHLLVELRFTMSLALLKIFQED